MPHLDYIYNKLFVQQRKPFDAAIAIYKHSHVCLNVGDRGTGKTDFTCLLAKYLDLPLFIVCTVDLQEKWRRCATKYGVEIVFIISYQTLAGRSNKCNHPYLKCVKNGYKITKHMKEIYESGVFVVFDEYQMAKNKDTLNRAALTALTAKITKYPRSKLAMVSASPYERKENSDTIPTVAGIVTEPKLIQYNEDTMKFDMTGIKQLIRFCKKIDKVLVREYLPDEITDKNIDAVYYDLISKALIPTISVSIPKHENNHQHIIENRFYELNSAQKLIMLAAEEKLHRSIAACMGTGQKAGIGAAGNQYENEGELVYIEVIAKEIKRLIKQDPLTKHVILVNQHSAVDKLMILLNEYKSKIAVINGNVKSKEERTKICDKFCEDNDDIKILIGNLTICAKGLDLDDKFGEDGCEGSRTRIIWIPSNSKYLDVYHGAARSDRLTTKSNSLAIIVYADGISVEYKRLLKQSQKTMVLAESLKSHYVITFPTTATYNKNNKIYLNKIFGR